MLLKKALFISAFCVSGCCFIEGVFANSANPGTKAVKNDATKKINDKATAKASDNEKLGTRLSDLLSDLGLPELKIKGSGFLFSSFVRQDKKGDKDNSNLCYDGDITVEYVKRLGSFGIGAETQLKTRSGLVKDGRPVFKKANLIVNGDYIGTVKIGYTDTATTALSIGGQSSWCDAGYGGPDNVEYPTIFNGAAGALCGTGSHIDDGEAVKIAWFSPTLYGFTLGMSYTFNSRYAYPFKQHFCTEHCDDNGDPKGCWDGPHGADRSKRIFTVAGKYEWGSQDDFNFALYSGFWFGKSVPGNLASAKGVHNVRVWSIGTTIGYKDLKLSAGYVDNGKSLVDKNIVEERPVGEFNPELDYKLGEGGVGIKEGANAGKVYTVGLSYKIDRLTFSVGYLHSKVKYSNESSDKTKADIITAAVDYCIGNTGFCDINAFFEYNHVSTKTNDLARMIAKASEQGTGANNKGNLYFVGAKILF